MSRSKSRKRNRRARFKYACEQFQESREDALAFSTFLFRIVSEEDFGVWEVAREVAEIEPLDEEEKALIARVVAPHLAGLTSRAVDRRHSLGIRAQGHYGLARFSRPKSISVVCCYEPVRLAELFAKRKRPMLESLQSAVPENENNANALRGPDITPEAFEKRGVFDVLSGPLSFRAKKMNGEKKGTTQNG